MSDPAATPPVTVYWRPGCGFCAGLFRGLERTGLAHERVNIWEDEAAASHVRSVANGNETVPTVVVGDVTMVNPSAAAVLDAIRAEAPHLEPDDQTPEGGLLDRVLGR